MHSHDDAWRWHLRLQQDHRQRLHEAGKLAERLDIGMTTQPDPARTAVTPEFIAAVREEYDAAAGMARDDSYMQETCRLVVRFCDALATAAQPTAEDGT
jgi:hypothetical protein